MISATPMIRDRLVIDSSVKNWYDALVGPEPALLLAREVVHSSAFVLRLTGRPLMLIADRYDGNGGMIDGRGENSTVHGSPGANGASAKQVGPDGVPSGPGGEGGAGGDGGPGGAGTTVALICRSADRVHIETTGGAGGNGARGGNGGRGGDGFTVFSGDPENPDGGIVAGTPGGLGGPGGSGGDGGAGGSLTVLSETALADAVLLAGGGAGGLAAFGGRAGRDGRFAEHVCPDGEQECAAPPGVHGRTGAGDPPVQAVISPPDRLATIHQQLGPIASEWSDFRTAMGEFHYRTHNNAIPERADRLRLARAEFESALALNPDNERARQLLIQIDGVTAQNEDTGEEVIFGGGANVLGLPRDLDLLPRFEDYIDAFTRFGTMTFEFLNVGIAQQLTAAEFDVLARFVDLRAREARALVEEADQQKEIAGRAAEIATQEVELAQLRLDNVKAEIEAAMAAMQSEPFTIGDAIGTVAAVAGAVVGVIGGIATGGAALIALVPSMMALTTTLTEQSGPIAFALFHNRPIDVKKVENAYQEVGKNTEAIVTAGKSIVNFIDVVDRISAGSRPSNAKHVALVRRGAELAHELLIAGNRSALADITLDAAKQHRRQLRRLAEATNNLAGSITADAASLRQTGLHAVQIAQAQLDLLLDFAFRAQRSLEIYTLEDQEANLLFDAGAVHPDVVRGYADGMVTHLQLMDELTTSWGRLLTPIGMQRDYLAFFGNQLDADVLRLSFTDPALLAELRASMRLPFRVDSAMLGPGRFDAKISGLAVALVGAASSDGVFSVELEHTGRHEQLRRDGSLHTQFLQPRRSIRLASTQRLQPAGVSFSNEPPLTAPQQLAFWGRGVAGNWELHIPSDQPGASSSDFTGLSEVQVWIRYQFTR